MTDPVKTYVTHNRVEQSGVPFTIYFGDDRHQRVLFNVEVDLFPNVKRVLLRIQREGDYVTMQWQPLLDAP